jgi:hypothetical protein
MKIGDEVVVKVTGVSLYRLPASDDWKLIPPRPLETGLQGKVLGFSAGVVGEPRYVLVDFNGVVGHVHEASIEVSQ